MKLPYSPYCHHVTSGESLHCHSQILSRGLVGYSKVSILYTLQHLAISRSSWYFLSTLNENCEFGHTI